MAAAGASPRVFDRMLSYLASFLSGVSPSSAPNERRSAVEIVVAFNSCLIARHSISSRILKISCERPTFQWEISHSTACGECINVGCRRRCSSRGQRARSPHTKWMIPEPETNPLKDYPVLRRPPAFRASSSPLFRLRRCTRAFDQWRLKLLHLRFHCH